MSRLIEALLAVALLGLATVLIGPVAATILTPGWVETADARDWASMTFFLCVAAAFLLIALRLAFRRTRSVRGTLRSRDWWALAALALFATVCAAVASHWTIALPGLLPIAAAILLARRRARQERLVLVDADPSELPPRASFTGRQSSGPRPM
jgi:drug/metabolite transporter (DMT)-like permease